MIQFKHHPVRGEIKGDEIVLIQPIEDEQEITIRLHRDQWESIHNSLRRASKRGASKSSKPDESALAGFEQFWDAYPRKEAVANARAAWAKTGASAYLDQILMHVESMKSSQQWIEGFIPHAATYLNQNRWADADNIHSPFANAI